MHVFMLNLTAFVVRIKIEAQKSSGEDANSDLSDVYFEDIYDC